MMKLASNMKILIFRAKDKRSRNYRDSKSKHKLKDWMQLVSLDQLLILSKIKEMKKWRKFKKKSKSRWGSKRRKNKEKREETNSLSLNLMSSIVERNRKKKLAKKVRKLKNKEKKLTSRGKRDRTRKLRKS